MNVSFCTISFRHHLCSIFDLAKWGKENRFKGIEIWGIHAKHLADDPSFDFDFFQSFGLRISMISSYIPLEAARCELEETIRVLTKLCQRFNTKKLRIFAGQKGSMHTDEQERREIVASIRMLAQYVHERGIELLVETHPHTLADNVPSTIRLIEEVNHPAFKINFDVLHVWESGADPIEAIRQLRPFIAHFHLKNVTSKDRLFVFEPANVYAPAGTRKGMVPLFEGVINYGRILSELITFPKDIDVSLEWFGPNVKEVLESDSQQIHNQLEWLKAMA
jgi:3-dehydroshikimate dehydratase